MASEAGLTRRRGGLPRTDGRAARAGQGRRAREEGPARRHHGLPRHPRRARADRVAGLRDPGDGVEAARSAHRRRPRDLARSRARSASSCWTGPRSTPSRVARSPTRGSSSSTAVAWRCSTSSARCAGWSCTRCAWSTASSTPAATLRAQVDPDWRTGSPSGPLRHPRGARGAARGARPERAPVRLLQPARLPSPGLRLAHQPDPRAAARHRAGVQQRAARRPARGLAVHDARRGQGVGRAGAVRRDLRRPAGARGRDRWPVVARALRWHARRARLRRSAPWSSPARHRSAPATAGSRRSPVWRASPTWPASATWCTS